MARQKPRVPKAEFGDSKEFADALYEAGGPEYGSLDELQNLPGEKAAVLRAVFGANEAEFSAAVRAEEHELQRKRPHAFVMKWPSTRGSRRGRR